MRNAVAVFVCGLTIAGCARSPAPLSHTYGSADALAAAVLDRMASGDRAALEAMALSESEFRQRIWPELPASRPERNLPADYVWNDLSQKSRMYLRQTLAEHRGRRYRLVRVEFLGDSTQYRSFTVARKAQVIVRDEAGHEQPLRLFGSVVKGNHEYKLFSYVVD